MKITHVEQLNHQTINLTFDEDISPEIIREVISIRPLVSNGSGGIRLDSDVFMDICATPFGADVLVWALQAAKERVEAKAGRASHPETPLRWPGM